MLRIKPLFILCAALLTAIPTASADVNSDMNQFFNKLGFASNTTQPGVWQGQAAGYAYGGSLYARTQVKNIQLISMTLPDINAGCGGIDAYLGSFSFINGDQLQRFVKQIMSNAAGYFFDLALQTTVPEIKTAKDFLQKMASDINSMNLSSCQVAQGIVGGLFPQTQVSQQKVCQDIAGESNIFADWAASRQGCTVGGQSSSVRDKASDKDKEQAILTQSIRSELKTQGVLGHPEVTMTALSPVWLDSRSRYLRDMYRPGMVMEQWNPETRSHDRYVIDRVGAFVRHQLRHCRAADAGSQPPAVPGGRQSGTSGAGRLPAGRDSGA